MSTLGNVNWGCNVVFIFSMFHRRFSIFMGRHIWGLYRKFVLQNVFDLFLDLHFCLCTIWRLSGGFGEVRILRISGITRVPLVYLKISLLSWCFKFSYTNLWLYLVFTVVLWKNKYGKVLTKIPKWKKMYCIFSN